MCLRKRFRSDNNIYMVNYHGTLWDGLTPTGAHKRLQCDPYIFNWKGKSFFLYQRVFTTLSSFLISKYETGIFVKCSQRGPNFNLCETLIEIHGFIWMILYCLIEFIGIDNYCCTVYTNPPPPLSLSFLYISVCGREQRTAPRVRKR